LIAAGAVLIATGADALAFLPFLGCAAMMGAMVWMMMRGGRRSESITRLALNGPAALGFRR
jgi:hypothetical protein